MSDVQNGEEEVVGPAGDPEEIIPITTVSEPLAKPSVGRALVAACSVLFALAVVMAVLAGSFYSRYNHQTDERSAVEHVSGQFSTALLTYDYKHLDEAKRQVVSLATGNFRKDYEANFGALKALLVSSKSQSTSTVREIYLARIEHDATSAFIVLDLTVNGTAGSHRRLSEYVKLDLVKTQSGWRVDGVTNLNLGQQAAPAPVTTTTSTTAPK